MIHGRTRALCRGWRREADINLQVVPYYNTLHWHQAASAGTNCSLLKRSGKSMVRLNELLVKVPLSIK